MQNGIEPSKQYGFCYLNLVTILIKLSPLNVFTFSYFRG